MPYATAYRGLFQRANAKPGEVVLKHGAVGRRRIAAVSWRALPGLRSSEPAAPKKVAASGRARHASCARSSLDRLSGSDQELTADAEWTDLEMLANVNLAKDLGCLVSKAESSSLNRRHD